MNIFTKIAVLGAIAASLTLPLATSPANAGLVDSERLRERMTHYAYLRCVERYMARPGNSISKARQICHSNYYGGRPR